MKLNFKWQILYELALDRIGFKKLRFAKKYRYSIFLRDDCKCKHCGRTDELTLDHIIPKSRGGKSIKGNLQTLCLNCNQKKGSSLPDHPDAMLNTVDASVEKLITYIKESSLPTEQLRENIKYQISQILYQGAGRSQMPLYFEKEKLLKKLNEHPHLKANIERQLRIINFKIKRVNSFANYCKEHYEYVALKKFVYSRFGKKVLDEFYSNINITNEVQKRENPL